MKVTRKGMLLVVSGPSGAGKGTLVAKLLDRDPSFAFSVNFESPFTNSSSGRMAASPSCPILCFVSTEFTSSMKD